MGINKILARRGAPVPQQHRFDICDLQRTLKQQVSRGDKFVLPTSSSRHANRRRSCRVVRMSRWSTSSTRSSPYFLESGRASLQSGLFSITQSVPSPCVPTSPLSTNEIEFQRGRDTEMRRNDARRTVGGGAGGLNFDAVGAPV